MIIKSFERNEQDQVVAVGDKKIALPWDFVFEHKPQIWDEVLEVEDRLVFVKGEAPIEEEVEAIDTPEAPIEPVETQQSIEM